MPVLSGKLTQVIEVAEELPDGSLLFSYYSLTGELVARRGPFRKREGDPNVAHEVRLQSDIGLSGASTKG